MIRRLKLGGALLNPRLQQGIERVDIRLGLSTLLMQVAQALGHFIEGHGGFREFIASLNRNRKTELA